MITYSRCTKYSFRVLCNVLVHVCIATRGCNTRIVSGQTSSEVLEHTLRLCPSIVEEELYFAYFSLALRQRGESSRDGVKQVVSTRPPNRAINSALCSVPLNSTAASESLRLFLTSLPDTLLGGLHEALRQAFPVDAKVVASYEWDPNAVAVYEANYGKSIVHRVCHSWSLLHSFVV